MTKVSIIEIDLTEDINSIISEDVKELTGAAKQELDNAIELAQNRDALRDKKSSEKQQATDALSTVMLKAFDKLVETGDEGVLCSDIIDIVSEHVPNSSAFTTRMKKILRTKENPYTLSRKKHKGNFHYIFSAYNEEKLESSD